MSERAHVPDDLTVLSGEELWKLFTSNITSILDEESPAKENLRRVSSEVCRRLKILDSDREGGVLDEILQEGGIQHMPAVPIGRAETGAMQFGNDWPGVFIRGDNAMLFSMTLEMVLKNHGERMSPLMERAVLEGLAKTLSSCRVMPRSSTKD